MHAETRMHLENNMLSKETPSQENIYDSIVYKMSRIDTFLGAESSYGVYMAEEDGIAIIKRHMVSLCSDENVLKIVAMLEQLCNCTKNYWIVHIKVVNCMVCVSYLKKMVQKKMK